jgi:hypothetical protein
MGEVLSEKDAEFVSRLRKRSESLSRLLQETKQRLKPLVSAYPELKTALTRCIRANNVFHQEWYKTGDRLMSFLFTDLKCVLTEDEKRLLKNTVITSEMSLRPTASTNRIKRGRHVVMIDLYLCRYIFSLTKSLLPVFEGPTADELLDLETLIQLRKCSRLAAEIGRYYILLWRFISFTGQLPTPQDYEIVTTPTFGSFGHHLIAITLANLEQFAIAHELSHVLLGHTDELREIHSCNLHNIIEIVTDTKSVRSSIRDEEFRADEKALDIITRTMGRERIFGMSESAPFRMEGALLLLAYLEFLEKCAGHRCSGGPNEHPSAEERIENLKAYRPMEMTWAQDIMKFRLPLETRAGFLVLDRIRQLLDDAAKLHMD